MKKRDFDTKQRFGFRKYKWVAGAASVLLGTTIMFGVQTNTAHAATTDNSDSQSGATTTLDADKAEQAVQNNAQASANNNSQANSQDDGNNSQNVKTTTFNVRMAAEDASHISAQALGESKTVDSSTSHAVPTKSTVTGQQHDDGSITFPGESALDPNGNTVSIEEPPVIYGPNHQIMTIHYKDTNGNQAVDKDGKDIQDQPVSGSTDQKGVHVPIPNGWKASGKDTVDFNNVDQDSGKVRDQDITIAHDQITTKVGDSHTAGTKVDPSKDATDANKKVAPDVTYTSDIVGSKNIARHIVVEAPAKGANVTVDSNGNQTFDKDTSASKDQVISYVRSANIDTVTGDNLGYNNWQLANGSKNQFDEFTIPQVDGFTAYVNGVQATDKTISAKSFANNSAIDAAADETITITYKANAQHKTYIIHDDTSNTERTVTFDGVTSQQVSKDDLDKKLDLGVSADDQGNYLFDPKQNEPDLSGFTFTLNNPTENIYLIHNTSKTPVDPTKPGGIPSDAIKDDGNGKTSPVTAKDFTEDVTRTIIFHNPNHNSSDSYDVANHTQIVTLKRDGTYDPVTHMMTFGEWKPDKFTSVDVPTVHGYTVHISKNGQETADTTIGEEPAVDGYSDPHILVTYTANEHTVTYKFVDHDNNDASVGNPITVTGRTDDNNIRTGLVKPDHYDLIDSMPATVDFNGDSLATQVITIKLSEHKSGTIDESEAIAKHATDKQTRREVGADDFARDLTETITVNAPTHTDSQSRNAVDHSQHAHVTRIGYYNEVTNQIDHWSDWTDAEFGGYTPDNVPGYSIAEGSPKSVAPKTVHIGQNIDSYNDTPITINYTANDQSQSYEFVDDDNNGAVVDHVITITGKTDDQKDTGLTKPDKYDLAEGQSIPDSYIFKASGNASADAPFKIHVREQKDNKGDHGDINKDTKDRDGNLINITDQDNNDFKRTLTRTITVKVPTHDNENSTKDYIVHQTVFVTRTGVYNKTKNQIEKWNPWTTAVFEAYDPTTDQNVDKDNLKGYTLQNTVSAKVIDDSNALTYTDTKPVVTYKADGQDQYYEYVDDENNGQRVPNSQIVHIHGVTDQTVNTTLKDNLPANYKLVGTVDDTYKFKGSGNRDNADDPILIHVVEVRNNTFDPTDPNNKHEGTTTPDNKPLTQDDYDRTITRTITINVPKDGTDVTVDDNGNQTIKELVPQTKTQTVHVHRTGVYNQVTNKIEKWNDWVIDGSFDAYTPTNVAGFKPVTGIGSDGNVDEVVIDQSNARTQKDINVTVNYQAQPQDQYFEYLDQDNDNKPVPGAQLVHIHGVTGQTINTGLNDNVPTNYELADPNANVTYKFQATGNADATHPTQILVKEVKDNNADPSKVVNGNTTDKTTGKKVSTNDYDRTITRTVTINVPNSDASVTVDTNGKQTINGVTPKTETQTVHVHRTGVYNKVTNQIESWNNWVVTDPATGKTVQGFAEYTPEDVAGFEVISGVDPKTKKVDAYTVDNNNAGGLQSWSETINYQALPQKQYYQFVDSDTKTKVGSPMEVDGVTGQSIDPSKVLKGQVPANYDVQWPDNYKMLANGNASEANPVTINLVEHRNNSGQATDINTETKDKDGNKVTADDFTKTLTRTITFNEPNGENESSRTPKNTVQTITLKRTAVYNTKTNTIESWNNWQMVGKDGKLVSTISFDEFKDIPSFNGYTADHSSIDAKTLGSDEVAGYKDVPVVVNYTANAAHQTIHYVDENGKDLTDPKDAAGNAVADQKIDGSTDQTKNISVPDGWELVDPKDATTKLANPDKDGNIAVKNVKIKHQTFVVKHDNPHPNGSFIDATKTNGPKYENVTDYDLNQESVRTFTFDLPESIDPNEFAKKITGITSQTTVIPGAHNLTVTQKVAFVRDAIVDRITGQIVGYQAADGTMIKLDDSKSKGWMPSDGKTTSFEAITIPRIPGYTAQVKATGPKTDNDTTVKPHAFRTTMFYNINFLSDSKYQKPDEDHIPDHAGKQEVKSSDKTTGDDTKPSDFKPKNPIDNSKGDPIGSTDGKGTTPALPLIPKDNPDDNNDNNGDNGDGSAVLGGNGTNGSNTNTSNTDKKDDQNKGQNQSGQNQNSSKTNENGKSGKNNGKGKTSKSSGKKNGKKNTKKGSAKGANKRGKNAGRYGQKGKYGKGASRYGQSGRYANGANGANGMSGANSGTGTNGVNGTSSNGASELAETPSTLIAPSHEHDFSKVVETVSGSGLENGSSSEKTLPQTGNEENAGAVAFGAAMTALSGLAGLLGTKKRKDQD